MYKPIEKHVFIRLLLSTVIFFGQCMLGAPIVFVHEAEAEMPTITLKNLALGLSGEMGNIIVMQGDSSCKLILPLEIIAAVQVHSVICVHLDWLLSKIAKIVTPFDGLYTIE